MTPILRQIKAKILKDDYLPRQTIFSLDIYPSFLYIYSAFQPTGGWSNGKTVDSDSAYRGSNPCPPATFVLLSNVFFYERRSYRIQSIDLKHYLHFNLSVLLHSLYRFYRSYRFTRRHRTSLTILFYIVRIHHIHRVRF
jgi:hypothetical protein